MQLFTTHPQLESYSRVRRSFDRGKTQESEHCDQHFLRFSGKHADCYTVPDRHAQTQTVVVRHLTDGLDTNIHRALGLSIPDYQAGDKVKS